MLAIKVELLHGTIRAGSPDDTVLAGSEPSGEWPPSPARLFGALVAADGSRERCSVTDGEELTWLETIDPPIIFASPLDAVLQSELCERYVVVPATEQGSVQDDPARRALAVRPGVRQSPQDDAVVYVWASADPSTKQLTALRKRAARVGYLGCADSPVRITVLQQFANNVEEAWVPDPESSLTLPVPYKGFLGELDVAFDRWTQGQPSRRSWIRTVRVGYVGPGESQSAPKAAPHVIWLRFDRSIVGRKLLAVTETLRDAVFDHVQRLLPDGEEVAAGLHGHRPNGLEGPQARFLALPNVGHKRADGRLLGAAVWLPTDIDPNVIQVVRTAVSRLCAERLVKPGWFDIGVSVHTGERSPWASHPRRWEGPARRWVSTTPVVHERWTRRFPNLDEVSRWCEHADLPKPVVMRIQRHPMLRGALDLHPSFVFREGRERRPYSHLLVEFATAVKGPVVLGRGRQFGLGLMAPAHEAEDVGGG